MENHEYTASEIEEAKKQVNEKIGFYIHLVIYILGNTVFHLINLWTGELYWAIFPLLAWGLGLLFHGVQVFGFFNTSEWTHKQILKEIEKQRQNRLNE